MLVAPPFDASGTRETVGGMKRLMNSTMIGAIFVITATSACVWTTTILRGLYLTQEARKQRRQY